METRKFWNLNYRDRATNTQKDILNTTWKISYYTIRCSFTSKSRPYSWAVIFDLVYKNRKFRGGVHRAPRDSRLGGPVYFSGFQRRHLLQIIGWVTRTWATARVSRYRCISLFLEERKTQFPWPMPISLKIPHLPNFSKQYPGNSQFLVFPVGKHPSQRQSKS